LFIFRGLVAIVVEENEPNELADEGRDGGTFGCSALVTNSRALATVVAVELKTDAAAALTVA
jgi:hypothetical protein